MQPISRLGDTFNERPQRKADRFGLLKMTLVRFSD